jgi:hypothetical protein
LDKREERVGPIMSQLNLVDYLCRPNLSGLAAKPPPGHQVIGQQLLERTPIRATTKELLPRLDTLQDRNVHPAGQLHLLALFGQREPVEVVGAQREEIGAFLDGRKDCLPENLDRILPSEL